jgi:Kef-type K+ transport system membrane component KefB/voltage-gated potassium channel Kch
MFELAAIILIAAVLGVLMRQLKQPLILSYLVTGFIIAYIGWINLDKETFKLFAELGVVFLLFLIGLEINYDSLRLVGRQSIILGLGQIIFTFVFGFLIAIFFNFNFLASAYIGIALTFSSTIIIVKLLSEKKDTSSFYGKLSIGFLLVQDLVAILILIFLTGISTGINSQNIALNMFLTIIKGLILFGLILYIGRRFLPLVFDRAAKSNELLFLISLAWLFLMVALTKKLGFSLEVGGFLAGLALSNSSENFQIAAKLKPLRDFFIMIFFIVLGSSFVISNVSKIGFEIFAFSLFVLIGNPLIVLILMGILGYRKRTSFLTGLTVAQISEFSLILASLGLKIGHINEEVVALITGVGIITITVSTYLILNADFIFKKIHKYLSIFEKKKPLEDNLENLQIKKPVVLIGAHRTGQSIALNIPAKNLLVIDFDPDIISFLRKQGIDYIFGDIADPDVFEKSQIKEAKLVISTTPDFNDNMFLLEEIKKIEKEKRPKVIVRAETEKDALILYEKGADYVILPYFTAGQYLGKTITVDPEVKILNQLKSKDLEFLKMFKKA